MVQFIHVNGTQNEHTQDTLHQSQFWDGGQNNPGNSTNFSQGVTTKVSSKIADIELSCTELCANQIEQVWHQMGEGKSDVMNSPSFVAQVAGTSPSLMTPSAVVTSPRPTIIPVANQITFHTRAME